MIICVQLVSLPFWLTVRLYTVRRDLASAFLHEVIMSSSTVVVTSGCVYCHTVVWDFTIQFHDLFSGHIIPKWDEIFTKRLLIGRLGLK